VVVKVPFGERLLNWLIRPWGKRVRDGAYFHELNKWQVQKDLEDEIIDKVREKTRGYRD